MKQIKLIDEPGDGIMSTYSCAHCAQLAEAINELLQTMNMQEKREDGTFHISHKTARFIWDESKKKAEKALEDVDQ